MDQFNLGSKETIFFLGNLNSPTDTLIFSSEPLFNENQNKPLLVFRAE